MATSKPRTVIDGSERSPMPGATSTCAVDPHERIEISVRLRPKPSAPAPDAGGALGDTLPAQRRYLTRAEYAAAHGADGSDIAKVEAFAKAHGLAVVHASPARRTVMLSGSAEALGTAFGTQLHQFDHPEGTYRGRTGTLSVPDRPGRHRRRRVRARQPAAGPAALPGARRPEARSSRAPPRHRSRRRSWRSSTTSRPALDGSGQCIAIIELGGGFKPADIKTYFTGLGLPVPTVKAVSVDGGRTARPTPTAPTAR